MSIEYIKEKLLSNIDKTSDNHWLWMGGITAKGYGSIILPWSKKAFSTHRLALEFLGGINLEDADLVLHKPSCNIRHCINPEHLYIGNYIDNGKDKRLAGTDPQLNKTHCPQGHEYTEENTIWEGPNHRHCKKCRWLSTNKSVKSLVGRWSGQKRKELSCLS